MSRTARQGLRINTESAFDQSKTEMILLTPSSLGKGVSRQGRRQTIEQSQTVKPKVLESRVATRENFYTLSEGFKRVFSNDNRDQKMVVPVSGYGGHRRGNTSQNFFGKSFRDITV